MTSGFRWIARGGPSAIFCPWSSTDHVVGDVHDQGHVVLHDQASDSLLANLHDQLGQSLRLVDVQSRRPARRAAVTPARSPGPGRTRPAVGVRTERFAAVSNAYADNPRLSRIASALALLSRSSRHVRGRLSMPARNPDRVRGWRPTITFSSTVISGKSLVVWNVRAMPAAAIACGFQPVIGRSRSNTSPPWGAIVPAIRLNSVCLARAVWSYDRLDIPSPHGEADGPHRVQSAEGPVEVPRVQ